MMGQKCYKNGDCRCKGFDGICFYGKSCIYKQEANEAQKSPVSDFAKNVPNYPPKNI